MSQHGSLKSDTDGAQKFGTWRFTRWDTTPAESRRPSSAPGSTCVLWLYWAAKSGDQDMVYVPLKVAANSLQLSYIGRGNTLVWNRV
ncbi:hypothetical protein [Mycolicibacterium brumae]|uniref:Uncharacterized protein n=1 Tax=Mycolicibacterium brumae TaxID=85968 RepID=A0A2G5PBR3_9MYCO|nr:hypothetical protein [Mycolicibacterium brumae]MCV7191380.1 hypothetical protein [Mycolicibacterium brumae]PIB75798.1 hypothetical protein CQY22_008725 [Mycolicibacterium brumae]RWA16092.1 hypothetical protein MBRU_08255 [Mycolicibacterium brumae DSM 44177]UWW09512.1 hypothetical protein L2Z93_002615 [Mycolicibacterium brumae]